MGLDQFRSEFRLILAAFVGPRTFDSALQLIQLTATVVLGVPGFFSDGFSCYLSALIEVYHTLKTFPRTGKPGRPKQPVKAPHPDLVYGQVVKEAQGPSPSPRLPGPLRCQTLRETGAVDQHEFAGASQPPPAPCLGASGAQRRELL